MGIVHLFSVALLLLVLLVILPNPPQVSSARILSVAFISTRSNKITYEPLLYELASRGHEITVVAPFISGTPRKNIREIQVIDFDKYLEEAHVPDLFEMKEKDSALGQLAMARLLPDICRKTYDLPQLKTLLGEKFDLVLMPAMFNECTAGFVHKFNASLILMSPVTVPSWIASRMGTPSPPSFVPNLFGGFGDQMTFFQRLVNFLVEGLLRTVWFGYLEPTMEHIYRTSLGDESIPSVGEIIKNASLVLSNSHVSLTRPRPLLPDVVEVGGMHCRPAKPLPKDLADFLNNTGSTGFVYFSMGSALKGSKMPEKVRKLFLSTFRKLSPIKVLWKWETEKMDGETVPANVKLSKWVPQQDVLGHPGIRAFITHGGFGGTTEAVYHGVPLVGLPMFGDQALNMQKSEAAGFAVTLDYASLTEAKLAEALGRVVKEPNYGDRARALSNLFRDQPDKPLERAVFWTEYVLRHGGAPHLRSAARDLNFLQYHSIDVIATLAGVVLLVLWVISACLRFVVRKICGGGSRASKSNASTSLSSSSRKKRN